MRLNVIVVVIIALGFSTHAAAQGRAMGIVQDVTGRPIRGATVRAINERLSSERTSTTDDKGRFIMLGIGLGPDWDFVATAPGFYASHGSLPVRAAAGAQMQFKLQPVPGPPPGSLTKDIIKDIAAAATLRDAGSFDRAVEAYQAIHTRNPKLSFVQVVLAGMYRERAEQEPAPQPRRALLERAAAAYGEVLKNDDADQEFVSRELAAVNGALSAVE